MIKTLHLLRHADAPMAYGMDDKDRPLSKLGITQAKSVAADLDQVDHVLCSGATRTKMTCNALIEAGAKFGKIDYLDDLYNAPESALLNAIHTSTSQNVLVIAHNPGIHALANTLVKEDNNADIEKLRLFYNPATLCVLECDVKNWNDLQLRENKLKKLIIPA